ncbi:hypothetical protein DICTH_1099 [Dictyoglomus thermophilum H-6-12]|uniref:Uncharacterized protein n=1 Tax=Dictyoglomus thermophilum (strain ATCC 35947 / DSM 3960 / H-6-12) TaxID=309799 RepID=B5YEJ0_DICT6|nr:hypothetical protein DICTH_1099 [Dictyoglomus thermophilum H-6-12]
MAQKFNNTTLPLKEERVYFLPLISGSVKSTAGEFSET